MWAMPEREWQPDGLQPQAGDRRDEKERVSQLWSRRLENLTGGYSASYDVERRIDERLLHQAVHLAGPPGRGLDVGSFYPATPRWLARQGWTVVCADIVYDCCRKAREVAEAEGIRLLPVQCDARALPFRPDTFDLVTDFATSVVIRDAERVVANEVAVVRPGGLYVFVSNNAWTRSGRRNLRRQEESGGTHPRWGYFSPTTPLGLWRLGRKHRMRLLAIDSAVHARDITGLVGYVLSLLLPFIRRMMGWRIGALYVKQKVNAASRPPR